MFSDHQILLRYSSKSNYFLASKILQFVRSTFFVILAYFTRLSHSSSERHNLFEKEEAQYT